MYIIFLLFRHISLNFSIIDMIIRIIVIKKNFALREI